MRCVVYRSLDKPSSFFGIKGRFMTWMGLLLVADLFLAFIIGAFLGTLFAFAIFVIGAVAAYLFVMSLQGKSSDRAFSLKMNARRYPRYVRTPPGPFMGFWNGRLL